MANTKTIMRKCMETDKTKLLVTGASGQLGKELVEMCSLSGLTVIGLDRGDADITKSDEIKKLIIESGADAVIHCAAYTAVDRAEDERKLCYDINVNGTKHIAEACREVGAKMLYLSSDYVFNGSGKKPWKTTDQPDPVNYYGKTKYLGELEVQKALDRYFIVRISWLYGHSGGNFVKTMVNLATKVDPETGSLRDRINVVDDQIGSPTNALDLAKLLCEMIQTEKYGIYHASNEGYCSWFEFASAIFALAGIKIKVNGIPSANYTAKAVRPKNSRLDKSSLTEMGFQRLPHWKDSLRRYLETTTIYNN